MKTKRSLSSGVFISTVVFAVVAVAAEAQTYVVFQGSSSHVRASIIVAALLVPAGLSVLGLFWIVWRLR